MAPANLKLLVGIAPAFGLFSLAGYELVHFLSAWTSTGQTSEAICVLIALASCVFTVLLAECAARIARSKWHLAIAALLVGPLAAYLLAIGYHAILDTQFEPVSKAWYSTWAAALSWHVRWLYGAAVLSAPVWLLLRFNWPKEAKSNDA